MKIKSMGGFELDNIIEIHIVLVILYFQTPCAKL